MKCRNGISRNGFTLVEMLVAIAAFSVVLTIAFSAFKTVMTKSKSLVKSEESNVEGVVGLDMFRRDLEQAGFGLFTDVSATPPSYNEASETRPALYNDATGGIPRAVIADNNVNAGDDSVVLTNTDYLAIKSTTLGAGQAAQKWTYINYTAHSISPSHLWPRNNLVDGVDNVIAVSQKTNADTGKLVRQLIYDTASPSTFYVTYRADGNYASTAFVPNTTPGAEYFYYGIDSNTPLAPFNRADYMVRRLLPASSDVVNKKLPATSPSCSPATGTLYKAVMRQTDGTMQYIPLLDCVADMQVVFGWNTALITPGLEVDVRSNADGSVPIMASNGVTVSSPLDIRTRLKLIKVYILAQDGGYDSSYVNTNTAMITGDADLGEVTLTRTIDLTGANYRNYHWKLYRIVVKPKNLN